MTKQSGLGDNLYIGGYDLSGDTGAINNVGGGPAALPITGIDKDAFERKGGVRDGRLEFQAWFNDAAGQAHAILSPLPTADTLLLYYRGTSLGGPAAAVNAKQVDYNPTRGQDGSLTIAVSTLANQYGCEWCESLTAGKRTDSGAANGTGVDFGASSSFGLQAYLQVFAFTGTDVTIKLQESSDDGAVDTYADVVGGGFTAVTSGPTSERIQTARNLTVEQWLRVVTTTSGGFSNLEFAVAVAKNETEVVF